MLLSLAVPAAGTTAPPEAVAWTPCPEDPAVECGTVSVPIDWTERDGDAVQVALARRKATRPEDRIGSLVINPGGPGGSGVDAVLSGGQFSTELTSRFDIVGFDPRGVGRSHPVVCSSELLSAVPSSLGSQANFDRWLDYNRRPPQTPPPWARPLALVGSPGEPVSVGPRSQTSWSCEGPQPLRLPQGSIDIGGTGCASQRVGLGCGGGEEFLDEGACVFGGALGAEGLA
nr:alpha/beta fold hydrolase [Nonomuraea zeae]